MKRSILILAFALIASMLYSQDFVVRVDSVAENTAYVQVTRVITDTVSLPINMEVVQPKISVYNNQIKFLYKAVNAYNNELTDPTYTDEFKAQIQSDIDGLESRLRFLLRERSQMVAIRDSIISYLN
jgi:hypothetical protein